MKENYDILIGEIVAAWGIKGHVKIKYFTEFSRDLTKFDQIFDQDGNVHYTITITKDLTHSIIAKIKNINNRNQAENLIGRKLFIKRNDLPTLQSGTYYHNDLIGMDVYSNEDRSLKIGKVCNVANFGASDLIEIDCDKSKESFYHPFTPQFIAQVDTKNGIIYINSMNY